LYKLLKQRLGNLKQRKEEQVMKTTECKISQYLEGEQRRSKFLLKYSAQELEELIVTSGKGYALEFARYFHEYGNGILTQIREVVKSRSRSQLTKEKKKTNVDEGENLTKIKKFITSSAVTKKLKDLP